MKKALYFIILTVFVLTLSGCGKLEIGMDIKKDKSMDFSVVLAADKGLMEKESLLEDDEKELLKERGFTISQYSDNSRSGYRITRHYNNIDDISSETNVEYELGAILNYTGSDFAKIFKMEKGFIKNKYTAKFSVDITNDDILGAITDGETEDDVTNNITNCGPGSDETNCISVPEVTDCDSEEDCETLVQQPYDLLFSEIGDLDMKFSVSLPYSALSSNATIKNGDTISWNLVDLTSGNINTIEFSFELYNMINVYMIIGIVILIIVIGILALTRKKKPPKTEEENIYTDLEKIEQAVEISATPNDSVTIPQNQGVEAIEDNKNPEETIESNKIIEENESKTPIVSPSVIEEEII